MQWQRSALHTLSNGTLSVRRHGPCSNPRLGQVLSPPESCTGARESYCGRVYSKSHRPAVDNVKTMKP